MDCLDSRECFAKKRRSSGNGSCYCDILVGEPYSSDKCPFAKPHREYTDGVYYPTTWTYPDKVALRMKKRKGA